MAYAAGAMALMRYLTKGALRQTKRLSPYKSTVEKVGKGKKTTSKFVGIKIRLQKL